MGATLDTQVADLAARRRGNREMGIAIVAKHIGELALDAIGKTDPMHLLKSFGDDEKLALQECGWKPAEIKDEYFRQSAARRQQEIAGTTADRERDAKNLRTAEKALASKGPGLRSQIEVLQNQISALEDAVTDAEQSLSVRAEALQRLRKFASPECRDRHAAEIKRIRGLEREDRDEQIRSFKAMEKEICAGDIQPLAGLGELLAAAEQLLDDPTLAR